MYAPLISICIPAYNGQKFFETCLDSAIGQTYRNIEIIIVDDCSTDKTYEIAKTYAAKDNRIKLFRNEKNTGLVPNWNRCLELAKGEWIKFLFQDDYLSPDCIEVMMANITEQDKIIACKRTFLLDEIIDEDKKRYYKFGVRTFENLGINSKTPVFIKPEQVAAMAGGNICMNFIGEPTLVMFKKDAVSEIGTFNQDLEQICDLEYFLRIATRYGIKYIPETLACFRIHSQSATAHNVSARSFIMKHLETVITSHQLLYSGVFSAFRNELPFFKKIKLNLYFSVHVYEAVQASLNTTEDNKKKWEKICKKYPETEKHKNGTILIKFIFGVIRLRRNKKTE